MKKRKNSVKKNISKKKKAVKVVVFDKPVLSEAEKLELITIDKAKKGNARAMSKLCLDNYRFVFNCMIARTRNNRALSEDLTQDALIKMITSIKQYSTYEFKFRSWLSKIINSVFIDNIRYEDSRVDNKSKFFDLSDTEGNFNDAPEKSFNRFVFNKLSTRSVEHDFINDETRDNMRKAILEGIESITNDNMKLAIQLDLTDELTYEEMADRIGVSLSNVKVLINRAKTAILKHIVSKNSHYADGSLNKRIVQLSVVGEMSNKEIAKSLGCGVKVVDSSVETSLSKIFNRSFLEEESMACAN